MRQMATFTVLLLSAGALSRIASGQQAAAPIVVASEFSLQLPADANVATLPVTDVWSAPRAPAAKDHWEQSFAPYLWIPAFTGKTTIGSHSARNDGSVGDTWNTLKDTFDAAFLGHYEARYDDAGVMVDLVYLDLTGRNNVPGGGPSVDSEVTATITEVGGFERLARWDDDPQTKSSTSLEMLGGIRNWYTATNIDVDAAGIHAKSHNEWTDVFVGMRLLTDFNETWGCSLRGDIGGFSLFNGCKGTWQAVGTVTYATSETGRWALGWRQLVIDYSSGDATIKQNLSGPFLGYIFAF